MAKRILMTTAAVVALSCVTIACGSETDDAGEALVTADPDSAHVQRAKWANIVLKQGAQADGESDDLEVDRADEGDAGTSRNGDGGTVYGPVITVKPKG